VSIPEAQNKFAKHDAARAAQRKARHGVSRAEAAAESERRHATWVSPARSQPQGGLILDQKTLAAKAAALNQRKMEPEPTTPQLPASTINAIVEFWLYRNPTFFNSPFNGESMKNFLAKAWHERGVAPSIELMDAAFAWLQANGHLETDPRIPRKRGDVARASVPRIFEYATPEQVEELEQKNASEAVEKRKREDAFNRTLSLDELRSRAQTGRGAVSRDALLRFQG